MNALSTRNVVGVLSQVSTARTSAGVSPEPGATSRLPAWWSATDWIEGDVRSALAEHRDVCREHHVEPDTVVAVARGMAYFADDRTGRDCRPTNDRLIELVQVSLSTIKRARRVLKALGLVVELVRGRSVMNRAERLQAWRRGSSHRRIAATFALCSRPGRRRPQAPVRPPAVDGDPPPSSPKESCSLKLRRTHLRSQTEKSEEERAPRAAPTKRVRRARRHDPVVRRLAERVKSRFPWLSAVSVARLVPLLTPLARADWTVRDVEMAVADSMAARGWRAVPKDLKQPAAYLATLLSSADPADRPSVLDDQLHAAERAHDRLSRHGAPCVHGVPGGDVVSPLTAQRGCPLCRAVAGQ